MKNTSEELLKPGFVYIWFDSLRIKFYIGSHRGRPDDGYISSSIVMNRAYNKRPLKFWRRILFFSEFVSGKELRSIEQKWLNKIDHKDLNSKYYNIKKRAAGGNGGSSRGKLRGPRPQSVKDKISKTKHMFPERQCYGKKDPKNGRFISTQQP